MCEFGKLMQLQCGTHSELSHSGVRDGPDGEIKSTRGECVGRDV